MDQGGEGGEGKRKVRCYTEIMIFLKITIQGNTHLAAVSHWQTRSQQHTTTTQGRRGDGAAALLTWRGPRRLVLDLLTTRKRHSGRDTYSCPCGSRWTFRPSPRRGRPPASAGGRLPPSRAPCRTHSYISLSIYISLYSSIYFIYGTVSSLMIHIRVHHRHEAISGGRPTHLASWSVGKTGRRPQQNPAAGRGSWLLQGEPRGRRGRVGGPGRPRTHLAAAGPMMPPAAGTRTVREGGAAPRGPGCATSRNEHGHATPTHYTLHLASDTNHTPTQRHNNQQYNSQHIRDATTTAHQQ